MFGGGGRKNTTTTPKDDPNKEEEWQRGHEEEFRWRSIRGQEDDSNNNNKSGDDRNSNNNKTDGDGKSKDGDGKSKDDSLYLDAEEGGGGEEDGGESSSPGGRFEGAAAEEDNNDNKNDKKKKDEEEALVAQLVTSSTKGKKRTLYEQDVDDDYDASTSSRNPLLYPKRPATTDATTAGAGATSVRCCRKLSPRQQKLLILLAVLGALLLALNGTVWSNHNKKRTYRHVKNKRGGNDDKTSSRWYKNGDDDYHHHQHDHHNSHDDIDYCNHLGANLWNFTATPMTLVGPAPVTIHSHHQDQNGTAATQEAPSSSPSLPPPSSSPPQVIVEFQLPYCGSDQVCMFVQTDCFATWHPIARSYNGHAWEAYTLSHLPSATNITCHEPHHHHDHDDNDHHHPKKSTQKRDPNSTTTTTTTPLIMNKTLTRFCSISLVVHTYEEVNHTSHNHSNDDPAAVADDDDIGSQPWNHSTSTTNQHNNNSNTTSSSASDTADLFYAVVSRSVPSQYYMAASNTKEKENNVVFARFLEQATFGTTRRDLEIMKNIHANRALEYQEQKEPLQSPPLTILHEETTTQKQQQDDDDHHHHHNNNSSLQQTTTVETTKQKKQNNKRKKQRKNNTTASSRYPISTTISTMARWMWKQIRLEPSLHRVFWRRHVTARRDQAGSTGRVTHPCQAQAAYRNFAFTPIHAGQVLEIVTIPSSSSTSSTSSTRTTTSDDHPLVFTMSQDDGGIQTKNTATTTIVEGAQLSSQQSPPPSPQLYLLLVNKVALTIVEGPIRFVGEEDEEVEYDDDNNNEDDDGDDEEESSDDEEESSDDEEESSDDEEESSDDEEESSDDEEESSDDEEESSDDEEDGSHDKKPEDHDKKAGTKAPLVFESGSYLFCEKSPEPFVGGNVWLRHPEDDSCTRPVQFGSLVGNPLVRFDDALRIYPLLQVELPKNATRPMDTDYFLRKRPSTQRIVTTRALTDPLCAKMDSAKEKHEHRYSIPVVFGRVGSEYWIHDPRIVLQINTLSKPLPDGGGTLVKETSAANSSQTWCANVPRSWQNERSCFLSYHTNACEPMGCSGSTSNLTTMRTRTVICGSPGEVANDLELDGEVHRGGFDFCTPENQEECRNDRETRQIVWTTNVLTAEDQLRQRMAWALSQIMIITNQDTGLALATTESYANFYDIFVRNAFGNYRTILKEVSYNVLMGYMLTYHGSKSTGAYRRDGHAEGVVHYADENYAREIMQLFTIGLYELHEDGTRKLDEHGRPIRTYSNDDLLEYARVWTGFRENVGRGNKDDTSRNRIDPMKIEEKWRDVFPKMGLGQQYIGDGYPLCADRPDHHFLKRGAKYILLGENPLPELQRDNKAWALHSAGAVRFVADPMGDLNKALCGFTGEPNSPCMYPPVVTLTENLMCAGNECSLDTVRVVEVTGGVFYEYVPLPCVHQAFFENAQKIKKKSLDAGAAWMCADPRIPAASTACCFKGGSFFAYESYWGEMTKASTAQAKCVQQAKSQRGEGGLHLTMCTSTGPFHHKNCSETAGLYCAGDYFYWMSKEAPCRIKAKIDGERIALVHSVPDEAASEKREFVNPEEDQKTFFRAQFLSNGDKMAELGRTCTANPECSIAVDGYCMCNVVVTNEQAYFAAPTREEVLSSLTIGSFHPDVLDGPFTMTTEGSVNVHADEPTHGRYSNQTVFEVVDDFGVIQLRRNVRSVVRIGGTNITFRNPVHFMSFVEPTVRDAQYETDAALDHYLYHKNTAPFLAIRLAQRFGISNPSPGYIRVIADAFRKGIYSHADGRTEGYFGQGLHGDLEATVAAILLDREARSVVLDADPVHGAMKEPILKITALMRNLEFTSTPEFPLPRFSKDLQQTLGQMIYQAPSIFSFFHPEFQPTGVAISAGLVSPEAEVHSAPQIIGTMNGLLTMIKYGLDRCFGGLGHSLNWDGTGECRSRIPGEYVNASSYPEFVPVDANSAVRIVDELALVMTSGRLSTEHRDTILEVINSEPEPMQAILKAEQLIASSSEFHSTGTITNRGRGRRREHKIVPTESPYKALVVLMLVGGCDSYNLVVPHTCSATNDAGATVMEQYISERGEIGLNHSERNLSIAVEGQPCEKFAIHKDIPVLKELYEHGELSFFLNAGLINKPSTKKTYEAMTVSHLFAHDAMQAEVQRIDPYNEISRTGFLHRVSETLNSEAYGFQAQTISINSLNRAVQGDDATSPSRPLVVGESGPQTFNERPATEQFDPRQKIEELNGANHISSNIFGDYWSDSFMRALDESDFLTDLLDNVSLNSTDGSSALEMIVKLMETRDGRGKDRDLFFTMTSGGDHHANQKDQLAVKFAELNEALFDFRRNLKGLDLWENVTLLVVSEFGRTVTPNTNRGSDHGWGGHYFAMGGALKGGKMFGKYPTDITSQGPLNTGRGRMIPTLSWESILAPMSEWLGVEEKDFGFVLPNARQTNTTLIPKSKVFEEESYNE